MLSMFKQASDVEDVTLNELNEDQLAEVAGGYDCSSSYSHHHRQHHHRHHRHHNWNRNNTAVVVQTTTVVTVVAGQNGTWKQHW